MYYLKFSDVYFDQNKLYSAINSSGNIRDLSDETVSNIPRDIKQRGFSFSPLQYLALNQIFSKDIESSFKNERIGIFTGSETSGFQEYFKQGRRFYEKGLNRVSPLTIARTIHNSGSAVLAIDKQFKGVSGGFNGDESIGLVSFLDSVLTLESNEQDVMIFGCGEQLFLDDENQTGCAMLGLISKQQLKDSYAFSISFSLGRGKPWLSEKENQNELLECAKNQLGDLPDNKYFFNQSNEAIEAFDDVKLDNYQPLSADLKSLGPLLGFEYCLNSFNEFVYIHTSKDGFGVILVIKKVS